MSGLGRGSRAHLQLHGFEQQVQVLQLARRRKVRHEAVAEVAARGLGDGEGRGPPLAHGVACARGRCAR